MNKNSGSSGNGATQNRERKYCKEKETLTLNLEEKMKTFQKIEKSTLVIENSTTKAQSGL